MNCKQINEILIQDYLARNGIQPSRISGHNFWYLSPLREENNPSFKVNTRINQWYDFGEGKGGKLLDLLIQIYNLPLAEIIQKFTDHTPDTFSFGQQKHLPTDEEPKITAVKALNNQSLLEYLEERKIPSKLAKSFCEEIHYQIRGKNYFGIGFKNDSGGYEIRNRYFKGSLTKKDISTIKESADKIYLFEGFMDFLSAKAYFHEEPFSAIVLNSASNIDKAIPRAEELKEQRSGKVEITCYFDLDATGRNITERAIQKLVAFDGSEIYKGFTDFNDFYQAVQKENSKKDLKSRRLGRRI